MKKILPITLFALWALGIWPLFVFGPGRSGAGMPSQMLALKIAGGSLLLLVLYFLPALIAAEKDKRNRASILTLDLFLGWTLVGWVVALCWALAADAPATVVVTAAQTTFCTACGLPSQGNFCQNCGKAAGRAATSA